MLKNISRTETVKFSLSDLKRFISRKNADLMEIDMIELFQEYKKYREPKPEYILESQSIKFF